LTNSAQPASTRTVNLIQVVVAPSVKGAPLAALAAAVVEVLEPTLISKIYSMPSLVVEAVLSAGQVVAVAAEILSDRRFWLVRRSRCKQTYRSWRQRKAQAKQSRYIHWSPVIPVLEVA